MVSDVHTHTYPFLLVELFRINVITLTNIVCGSFGSYNHQKQVQIGPRMVSIIFYVKLLNNFKFHELEEKMSVSRLEVPCLKPLSTIFQLYRGGHFDWWRTSEYPE